ncbi:hypothetical protein ENUP19_0253G0016 [Entamoeba nuttalli]|uniref:Uncharacterized protein n=1 Tax=Entamoeba nuttalli TaxID=412467 RepID=A0ABQ0DRT2_9EUKA
MTIHNFAMGQPVPKHLIKQYLFLKNKSNHSLVRITQRHTHDITARNHDRIKYQSLSITSI